MRISIIILSIIIVCLCTAIVYDIRQSGQGEPFGKMVIGTTLKEFASAINVNGNKSYYIDSLYSNGESTRIIVMNVRKGGSIRRCVLTTDGYKITNVEIKVEYVRYKSVFSYVYRIFKKDTAAPITQLDLPDESSSPEDASVAPVPAN
jgi:hypothetical protein